MATGTGLPGGSDGSPVLAQAAGGVSADALFNADSWSKIANAGEQLAKAGGDYLKVTEHKAQVGYLADQDVAIQRKQIELRNEHANDPQKFDAAWTGYSDGLKGSVEPWAVNHVRATLGSYGNNAYSSILNETRVKTETDAKTSWSTLEDQAANDVQGAAMAGTLNTPAGQLKIEKYRNIVNTGVTSEFIPKEVAEQRIATLESTATVYAARTGIQNTFSADGPIAATKHIDDLVRDEKLKLSPEQRLTLGARLRADVHGWDAERRQNLDPVDLESQSLLKAKQGGIPIPQSRIDDVIDRYKRFGGQAQAASFLADIQHSEDLSFLGRVPVSEAAAWVDRYKTERGFNAPPQAAKTAVDYFTSQGWTPAQAQGIVGNLIHESGLNPSAVHDSGTGLGVAGWREDRLTALKAFANANGKSPNDFQTQLQFINQELGGSESASGAKLRAATTPQDAAAAFIHFERPQGYDPNDPTKASGYSNRVGQAVRLAGGAVPTTPNDTTFIGKANTLVAKRVSDDADAIIKAMDSNVLPTEQRINDLLTAASATNTPEVLQRVSEAAAEYQMRRQFGRMPEPQLAAIASDLHRKAVTEGLSTTDARVADIATEMVAQSRKALADDPLSHTVSALADTAKIPPLAPLVTGNSAQFQAGLQTRAQWADTGTRTYETAPMPALTSTDVTQLKATLEAASFDDKVRIFGDMAKVLPPNTFAATMDKLGKDTLTQFAGSMAQERPELAREILRGADLMNIEKTGDKSALVRPAFQNKLGGDLYPSSTDQNNVTNAALAVYTARRGTAGALYDPTDSAGIEKAIEDVTGKITKRNGVKVAVPPGMTEGTFTRALSGMTVENLAPFGGAYDRSGKPFNPSFLGDKAVLKQLGPGNPNYVVGLPDAAARDGFAPVMTAEGRPLVIDVKQLATSQGPQALTGYQAGRTAFKTHLADELQTARRQSLEAP